MDVDIESCSFHAGPDCLDAGEYCLTDLVNSAKEGDGKAWNTLVRRFSPLVWSITYQFRLPTGDAEDVTQVVWLRLIENLDRLRTGCAIPGWIRTTTRHEAMRVVKARRRVHLVDPGTLAWMDLHVVDEQVDRDVLQGERDQAVRDGLAQLDPRHRDLLILLHAERRPNYQRISKTLGMPPGSIGPTRARCLEKLRRTEAVRSYVRPGNGGREHDNAQS
jgi:RNA polymerase sigma factor (sigma-70 family)